MSESRSKRRGLVLIFTGEGKGKTTAALGMVLRAMGYGYRTLVIQFVKGTWEYGEMMHQNRLGDLLEVKPVGLGYIGIRGDSLPREKHAAAARRGLALAREAYASGQYDMIVLDEINIAIEQGVLDAGEVKKLICEKPPHLFLVLTGRGAPDDLIEIADCVTEMRKIKHHYDRGIEAQEGIEF